MRGKIIVVLALVLSLGIWIPAVGAQDGEVYVMATDSGGRSFFMLSYEGGTFSNQDSMGPGPGSGYPYGTAIADFDNDGDFDFIMVRGAPGSVYLYEKVGAGKVFEAPRLVAACTQSTTPADIAVADFNEDGYLDFIVTHYLSTNSDLFLGDGSNGFTFEPLYGTEPVYSLGADAADFNNDGHADFVVAPLNGNGFYFKVNLGNGDGTFASHDVFARNTYSGVAAGDFDGDGNADLIGSRIGYLDVYWGAGDGTTFVFGGATALPLPVYNNPPVDNFDFNGDGLQDVIVGKYRGAQNVGVGFAAFDDFGNWYLGLNPLAYASSAGSDRVAIAAPSLVTVDNSPPVALIGAVPQEVAVGDSVVFDGSGSSDEDGEIVTYAWDFGDGSEAASGANVSHSFDAAGTYTVTLTVVDDMGAEAVAEVQVTVIAPPVAVVTPVSLELTAGTTAVFDASESYDLDGTIVGYEWNFGDNTSRAPEAPVSGITASHVYEEAGEYTVTLTVTDDRGFQGVAYARVIVSAIGATVRIMPRTLNLNSKGRWITATIRLPEGCSVADIDLSSVGLEVGESETIVPATYAGRGWMARIRTMWARFTGKITVKFDRQAVAGVIGADVQKVTLTVVGKVQCGDRAIDFEGSDTIRVIQPKPPKEPKGSKWSKWFRTKK